MINLLQHLAVVLSLALFHIVGPVPIDLGVHAGVLAPLSHASSLREGGLAYPAERGRYSPKRPRKPDSRD